MNLLVVIVNYRTADLVTDCLQSLEAEVGSLPGMRVVVVDNASGDGSADRLAAAVVENGWERWASILPVGHNGGFASGNNAAIRPALEAAASPRYVLLLNPDTVVHAGALPALVDFMEARPDVGIAGSRLEDPDGTPQRSAFRFPSVLGEFDGGVCLGPISRLLSRWIVAPPVPEGACQVDWVAGASLMARREVLEAIGLLDEGYFMYFEEVDFCRKALLAGWPCWYVPNSRVVHLVGQSSGVTDTRRPPRRRPAYWFEARRRYLRTHLGAVRTLMADLAWAAGYSFRSVRHALERRTEPLTPHLLRDFLRHNLNPFPTNPTKR